MSAVARACAMRSAGTSQWKLAGSRRPVALSSRRSSTWRMMRNDEGTRPEASPECTPSLSISTLSVPLALPRRLVVSPSCSQLPPPESTHTTTPAAPDQAHDARVRQVLALEFLHCGNAGVAGVAGVGGAAAVEFAVFVFGRPGAEVAAPARELRLLVQMAVHQHAVGGPGLRCRYLEEQHRCAAFEAQEFPPQTFHPLRLDPGGGVAHHGVEQPLLGPVGRKHRGFGGDGNVVLELANDVVIPDLADPLQCEFRLEGLARDRGVHGQVLPGVAEVVSRFTSLHFISSASTRTMR